MTRSSVPQLSLIRGRNPDEQSQRTPTVPRRASADVPELAMESRLVSKRMFGRFELLVEMGRGGMATLYLARIQGPQKFEKLVAIKRIHDHLSYEADFVDMFLDEARIAALIHHPNVATLFDMGRIDESYFIAMEYVHGQTLTDILKAATRHRDRFPWPEAVRIVANAAAGLHAAHNLHTPTGEPLNVVHRDVSPQNILISYDGHVKVVDFGIAYAAERLHTTGAGTLKGKAGYMAPEQTDGSAVDHRTDVFTLGVVLYESLTVSRLFRGDTDAETLLKVRQADVPSARRRNPDLPAELEPILHRALARRPQDRYDTAEELSEALEAVLAKEGEAVGRQRLADMMRGLFYDRRKLKDQQIRIALSTSDAAPLEAVRVEETSSSLLLPRYLLAKHSHSGRRRLWLLIGLVGVALAALAGILLWPGDRQAVSLPAGPAAPTETMFPTRPSLGSARPTEGAGAVASAPAPPHSSSWVNVTVQVRPRGVRARVKLKQRTYRGSSLRLRLRRSEQPVVLRVTAPGHHPESVRLVPRVDALVRVKLDRWRRRPRRPRRRQRRKRRKRPGLLELPK